MAGADLPKILVIDDEEDHLTIIRIILERAKYSVETCSSSREALSKLRENRYDAILCDVWMTGITGLGFYQLMREQFPRYQDRFVFVTAHAESGRTWEWILDKKVPYVTKPFSPDDLLSKLDEVLRGNAVMTAGMSCSKAEKRRERRLPIRTSIVVGRKERDVTGVDTAPLINLSRGGICFLTDRQYGLGERVAISYPSLDFNRLQHEGRVVRIEEVPDGRRRIAVDIREGGIEQRAERDRRSQGRRQQGLERRRVFDRRTGLDRRLLRKAYEPG